MKNADQDLIAVDAKANVPLLSDARAVRQSTSSERVMMNSPNDSISDFLSGMISAMRQKAGIKRRNRFLALRKIRSRWFPDFAHMQTFFHIW